MDSVWVIGNGGHAKVVIDALELLRTYEVVGILSDDPETSPIVPGLPHIGPVIPETVLQHNVGKVALAIGSNAARKRIAAILEGVVSFVTVCHPAAIVSASSVIGEGVFIAAGSVIQSSARIGDFALVNTAASVDHDCHLGSFCHIAPGCHLAGDVNVGEGALVGIGASVVPGVRIGEWAVVGAGAAVVADVPAHATAVGVPARVKTPPDQDF